MSRKLKRPIDLSIPLGTNKLASDTMFKERTLYTESAYSFPGVRGDNLWYGKYGENVAPGKVLYGRVDSEGYSMYPAEENLKQVNTPDRKTVFLLNFVADAFMDMQKYWNSRVTRDSSYSPEKGPLKNIDAYSGWHSIHDVYHKTYEYSYDAFTSRKIFLKTRRDEQIVDFDSFLKVFREYVELNTPMRPFTRSGQVVSKFCTPQISGLMVDIVPKPDHGDDYAKYVGYIQNDNFNLYLDTARRYGFAIDVNAPWRLIADIDSKPMKAYLKRYGVYNLNKFFKAYYIPTCRYDIEAFSVYMMNFYNSYVAASPNIRVRVPCDHLGHEGTEWLLIARKPLPVEKFEKDYPKKWWIRMYAWIRAKEAELTWNQTQFEQVVKKAIVYEKNLNIEAASRYIDSYCIDNRRRLHGMPTLSNEEVKEITIQRKMRGPQRATFKF